MNYNAIKTGVLILLSGALTGARGTNINIESYETKQFEGLANSRPCSGGCDGLYQE